MSKPTTLHQSLTTGRDRRRVPRYSCAGRAQISSLPLYESLLTARVRDLGLGGCCIECAAAVPLLDVGAQTEIVMKVNSWFFRARAHVKSIRGVAGISMEFTRMSAGASSMLVEMIADLEGLRQPPRWNSGNLQSSDLPQPHSIAIVGTVMPRYAEAGSAISHSRCGVRMLDTSATLLDIFV